MTAFVLKIIAMVSMLCDHCSAVSILPESFWYLGRFAFPLYAMMLVESYRHLKDDPSRLKKYVISLTILAVISEVAYDLAFAGTFVFMGGQNQILQFLTFVLAAILADRISVRPLKVFLWLAVIVLNQVFLMGYYALGIVTMLMLWWYLKRFLNKGVAIRLLVCSLIMIIYCVLCVAQEMYFNLFMYIQNRSIAINAFLSGVAGYSVTLLLIPVIALYKGQYGNPPKWFRIVYRYFYPAHLFILALAEYMLYRQ